MSNVLRGVLAKYWQAAAFYGGLLLVFGGLLGVQLGSLTHQGYSAGEVYAWRAGMSWRDIFHHPLNAPYEALVRLLGYLHPHSLITGRLASTIFALGTLTAFYWLVRYWYGMRTAFFGTLLFGSSAWFLHVGRLGTPEVLMFGLLMLAACGVWFRHSKQGWVVALLMLLAAVFLYVPGMVWFVAAGVLWQWRTIDRMFKRHLGFVTLGGFLMLAALVPLALAMYHTPQLARQVAGFVPGEWPHPVAAVRAFLEVPVHLFFRGPELPEQWLGRLPVLDIFTTAMVFLGAYVHSKHLKLMRAKLLATILLLGAGVVALGYVSLSVIVPFVYIVAASGIGLLCDRWFAVFPRNTIAQSVGLGLVSLAVLASCSYSLRHYFVAWPHAPATAPAFAIKFDTIQR
jgi:4-amino-4-deoxy-L-arabinose transferase-like glycosyltransferase